MRRSVLLLSSIIALAIGMPAFSAEKTTPGSFLAHRSNGVSALVNQVSSDKKVAARYAKHYGVSTGELISYFKNNLKLTKLSKSYATTLYFVNRSGKVQAKRTILKAGSPIFVGPNGIPMLDWKCGNPLGKTLPKIVPVAATPTAKPAAPQWQVAPSPALEVMTEATEILPVAMPIAATPALLAENSIPFADTGAISPFMLLGSAIPALLGGVRVHADALPSVPEPSSVLALMIGTSGILFHMKRRNRDN